MQSILLVEDDPDVGTLLERTLSAAGYKVRRAGTAAAAELLLDHRSQDLLLADLNLPDGSSIVIADKAKARGMRTLLITGNALRVSAEELVRHEYVLKPIRVGELLAIIKRLLASNLLP